MPRRGQRLYYVIREDGDGNPVFRADVVNRKGKNVYTVETISEGPNTGEIAEVVDGLMVDRMDVAGLTTWLRECETIEEDAVIVFGVPADWVSNEPGFTRLMEAID